MQRYLFDSGKVSVAYSSCTSLVHGLQGVARAFSLLNNLSWFYSKVDFLIEVSTL